MRLHAIARGLLRQSFLAALALTGAKVCVVASIALLISTFATSMVFTVAVLAQAVAFYALLWLPTAIDPLVLWRFAPPGTSIDTSSGWALRL